jgi:hypothetical protein
VRTAQTTAETISTDNNGSYATVSLSKLHAYESSLVISRRAAIRSHELAYLFLAKGTATGYVVGAVALADGNGYLIERRAPAGEIVRVARECGRATVEW